MTTREINKATGQGRSHVVIQFPATGEGHRVFRARTRDGKQEVKTSSRWIPVTADAIVFEC